MREMRRKCSKCLKKLCQEIFKLITILIDLAYGIYHFFLKEEEAKIRYANMVKFISTAFFKTLDTFKTFCCSSCFSKKKSGTNLDYEDILEELDYEIDRLNSKKDISILFDLIILPVDKTLTKPFFSDMLDEKGRYFIFDLFFK